MKHFIFLISTLICSIHLFSQSGSSNKLDSDRVIFDRYVDFIEPYRTSSIENILQVSAEFFIGTPYVAQTLEVNSDEQLVINLRQLDCTTLVENVIALSLAAKSGDLSFDNFINELKNIRYRNGEINDYSSRLHYTSDWVYEHQNSGVFKDLSSSLDLIKEVKLIDFMSSHRNAYPLLKTDDVMLNKIIDVESEINKRGGFYYLQKNKLASKVSDIPHMAIIAFTTSINGLDVTHMAFAYRKTNGELSFIHASSVEMKVVIDKRSLIDYVNSQKNCTGLIVTKLL